MRRLTQQPILFHEASAALREKLGFAKALEFWVTLGQGRGDYTKERKTLFRDETAKSLARKIQRTGK